MRTLSKQELGAIDRFKDLVLECSPQPVQAIRLLAVTESGEKSRIELLVTVEYGRQACTSVIKEICERLEGDLGVLLEVELSDSAHVEEQWAAGTPYVKDVRKKGVDIWTVGRR